MKIAVFELESVVSDDLSRDSITKLGEVRYFPKLEKEKLIEAIADSEAVLCSKIRMTADVMDACPNLKYIGLMATGYNNIDCDAARERGIVVTNIPSYSTDAVAQHTLSFVLQFATALNRYAAFTENGGWLRSPLFCSLSYPTVELKGKTMGIFGLGAIGERVAELCEAFGMKIIFHSRAQKKTRWQQVSLETLFRESDFLSVHCALSPETEHAVNKETLSLMKPSAFLINTSRGGVIDEKALADALQNDRIAGFAGDVLKTEPQTPDCPLIGVKNCILTPHVAWAPKETRLRLLGILAENLIAFQNGRPQNAVNL